MSLLYFIPHFPEHTSVLNHSPDLSQNMQQFAIVFVLVSSKLDIVLQKMSQNEIELFTNSLSATHLLVISQCLQMVSLFPFFFFFTQKMNIYNFLVPLPSWLTFKRLKLCLFLLEHLASTTCSRSIIPNRSPSVSPTSADNSFVVLISVAFWRATFGKSTSYITVWCRRPMSFKRKYKESKPAPKDRICR